MYSTSSKARQVKGMTIEFNEPSVSELGGTPSYRKPEDIKWIVIHHSGTNSGNVEVFRKYHKSKGWVDVGYHYVITNGNGGPDGEIQVGRPINMVGAHAPGANVVSVGICLVGDFNKSQPTSAQLSSLAKLVLNLMKQFNIPVKHIIGHKDVPKLFNQNYTTDCPGKNFSVETFRKSLTGTDIVGHWAEEEIRKVLKLGIMHGYSDGTFKPERPVTRAEMAVALLNLYNLIAGGK